LPRLLAGLGGGSHRRHGRTVPAGRARSLRLPHRLLLACACAGPVEPRARLDVQVRGRAEGLAEDRSGGPMKKLSVVVAALSAMAAQKPLRGAGAPGPNKVSAGNGTLIIGAYPKQFWIIDEATEKIVGTIPYQSGIPRRTTLSRDRKR